MEKCTKCFSELRKCEVCDGQTKKSILGDTLTCKTCQSTGKQCPTHGGFWQ